MRDGQMDPTLLPGEAAVIGPALGPTVLAGRYEIVALLGAGGMGRVYRAIDRELGEPVALKVLHASLVGSPETVERFRQEVRLARKVTHRNVARTFDIGEHAGEKFLTMELVSGEPLSARLERGTPPVAEVVAIAREIVAGMAAAHSVGVVHRDLKPDNVLLEPGGRVVITDFGIARAEAPDAATRTSGSVVGTPAYMAPEQIGGDVAVDARADQYAFGAMLFEMLTGERAWPGSSAIAVAVARLVEPPPDPRQRRPDLSRSLADVVLRCLARDRDARFASDVELAAALVAADTRGDDSQQAPIQRPPSLPERERSVAVLRFRNLGPQEDGYLVDGLGEDLVDVLSTVRGLRVRGRGDEDGAARDVVETGRKLGVDVIVDGSVRRAGEMLRVSARLVGVADGFQLWSARFDRSIAQAFALNDEVAHAIARALSKEHVEASRPQPSDPIAIDLYFQAKHAVGRFFSGAGSEEGRVLFDQALARAPNDPTILAAYVHAQIGRNFFAPLEPSAAKALVRRAIVAGEGLPDPWVALGAYRLNHLDDAASAVRALQKAIAIAPSSSDAHDLAGRVLLEAGEIEEAVLHLERALWLDPTQRWARIDLARAAALQGRWAHVRELLEGDASPEWVAHRSIHIARLGAWAGASEHLPAPTTSSGDLRIRAIGALFARARGEPPFDGDALEAIRREMGVLLARAAPIPRARRFFHQLSAEVAAAAGRPDGTLEFVEKAVENGLVDLAWMDRLSLLEPVRASPAFVIARAKVAARADAVVAAWRGPLESPASALASLA